MGLKLDMRPFFKGRASLVVNFSFLHNEAAKLRPERITGSEVAASFSGIRELKQTDAATANLQISIPKGLKAK